MHLECGQVSSGFSCCPTNKLQSLKKHVRAACVCMCVCVGLRLCFIYCPTRQTGFEVTHTHTSSHTDIENCWGTSHSYTAPPSENRPDMSADFSNPVYMCYQILSNSPENPKQPGLGSNVIHGTALQNSYTRKGNCILLKLQKKRHQRTNTFSKKWGLLADYCQFIIMASNFSEKMLSLGGHYFVYKAERGNITVKCKLLCPYLAMR